MMRQQVMTTLIVSSMMMLLLGVESRNDITTIQEYSCSEERVRPEDPYIRNVNSMIDQVVRDVPATPVRVVLLASPYPTTVAFVGGFCLVEGVTYEECCECMSAARNDLYEICGPSVRAKIALTVCGIKYDNNDFF